MASQLLADPLVVDTIPHDLSDFVYHVRASVIYAGVGYKL